EAGRLDPNTKLAVSNMFEYVLKNMRLGRPDGRAENFSATFLSGTTSSVSGCEVVLPHGMERTPYVAIPVLALQTVNCSRPVLTVTRVPDARNIYVSSTETDVPFCVY